MSKRWMGPPIGGLFLLGGLLLGGGGVQAQMQTQTQTKAITPSRAQVYHVPTAGETIRFEVPQMRLPNASVARRINRRTLRLLLDDNAGAIDPAGPAVQQLRQASRACCYDPNTQQWRVGQGFTGCGYQVLFNQGELLSLAYTNQFTGAYF